MECPKCSGEMVKARATSFGEEYDYCRACKMELAEIRRTHPELEEVPRMIGLEYGSPSHIPSRLTFTDEAKYDAWIKQLNAELEKAMSADLDNALKHISNLP